LRSTKKPSLISKKKEEEKEVSLLLTSRFITDKKRISSNDTIYLIAGI
jgi:hypothetical protein